MERRKFAAPRIPKCCAHARISQKLTPTTTHHFPQHIAPNNRQLHHTKPPSHPNPKPNPTTMPPPTPTPHLLRALRATETIKNSTYPLRQHRSHLQQHRQTHQHRTLHTSPLSSAQNLPKTTDRGPISTETTQTDFGAMDVFSNAVRLSRLKLYIPIPIPHNGTPTTSHPPFHPSHPEPPFPHLPPISIARSLPTPLIFPPLSPPPPPQ